MKRRAGINQTSAWVLAVFGAFFLFGIIFAVANIVAKSYQERINEESIAAYNEADFSDEQDTPEEENKDEDNNNAEEENELESSDNTDSNSNDPDSNGSNQ